MVMGRSGRRCWALGVARAAKTGTKKQKKDISDHANRDILSLWLFFAQFNNPFSFQQLTNVLSCRQI